MGFRLCLFPGQDGQRKPHFGNGLRDMDAF